jgi:hypothetical protein
VTGQWGRRAVDADDNSLIPAAVKALQAEFDEAQGPNRVLPRSKSDYFSAVSPKPTADQVWRALESRQSANTRADAYIKWQLLSGFSPDMSDEKTVRRVAALYDRAPAPQRNPLLEPRTRSEIEALGGRLRPGSEDQANDRIRELTDRDYELNRPIFSYRDALLGMLPNVAGRHILVFEEVALRCRLGWASDAMRDRGLTDIRVWSASASAAEVQQVAESLMRLRRVESDEMPRQLRPDGAGLRWDRQRARVESWDNKVQAMINELNGRSRSPGSGR